MRGHRLHELYSLNSLEAVTGEESQVLGRKLGIIKSLLTIMSVPNHSFIYQKDINYNCYMLGAMWDMETIIVNKMSMIFFRIYNLVEIQTSK